MRPDATRQLFGAAPVDQERQMWTMLLDRAQRQEHDHARIAGELRCSGRRQLGEPNHWSEVLEAGLHRGWPEAGAAWLRSGGQTFGGREMGATRLHFIR